MHIFLSKVLASPHIIMIINIIVMGTSSSIWSLPPFPFSRSFPFIQALGKNSRRPGGIVLLPVLFLVFNNKTVFGRSSLTFGLEDQTLPYPLYI